MSNKTYHGEHEAPDPESGAPAHNLTLNGIYPNDIYSNDAFRLYTQDSEDAKVLRQLHSYKNRPMASVKVYRAIPYTQTNQERIEELESHKRHILRTGKIPNDVVGFKNSSEYYEHAISEIERLKNSQKYIKKK